MESPNERRWPVIEMMDDDRARVIRAMSGAERLQMASDMYSRARQTLLSQLKAQHPDWEEKCVIREAAKILSNGASEEAWEHRERSQAAANPVRPSPAARIS
jgi:hypothetical protein